MINTDTIEITPELLGLLTEIDEFKGAWRALGVLAPERLHALRQVATIESTVGEERHKKLCRAIGWHVGEAFVPCRCATAGLASLLAQVNSIVMPCEVDGL